LALRHRISPILPKYDVKFAEYDVIYSIDSIGENVNEKSRKNLQIPVLSSAALEV
jgi:hypothetical protein